MQAMEEKNLNTKGGLVRKKNVDEVALTMSYFNDNTLVNY